MEGHVSLVSLATVAPANRSRSLFFAFVQGFHYAVTGALCNYFIIGHHPFHYPIP